MHFYRVSGLTVASEMLLAGATPMAQAGTPGVTVRYGDVPEALAAPTATGPTWEREGDTILLSVPRLARFLVSGGDTVTVALEDSALAHDASGFVLGSCFGILLHQRGLLVLHASAVAKDGRAIILCGPSGAGKSTTAAALSQRGYTFVADDICVVALNAEGLPVVLPDGRQLKLWQQSIEGLGLQARQGEVIRETFDKFFVAPDDAVAAPPLLDAIYLLRKDGPLIPEGIVELALPDALRVIDQESYRPRLRRQFNSPQQMLAQGVATLRHARAFSFTRPLGFDRLDAVLDTLVRHWQAL